MNKNIQPKQPGVEKPNTLAGQQPSTSEPKELLGLKSDAPLNSAKTEATAGSELDAIKPLNLCQASGERGFPFDFPWREVFTWRKILTLSILLELPLEIQDYIQNKIDDRKARRMLQRAEIEWRARQFKEQKKKKT